MPLLSYRTKAIAYGGATGKHQVLKETEAFLKEHL
jgi:hypothetical protein